MLRIPTIILGLVVMLACVHHAAAGPVTWVFIQRDLVRCWSASQS